MFMGIDPIGWIARAGKFFEVQEIPSFHKLQYASMSMEGATTHWFNIWSQSNLDSDWESFSTAFIKRFGDRHGNHIFERLSILKQEKPTETEIPIKKWETSTKFLKVRTNISERKHMLCKILNEEVDSHASQQDKNSMEGSGSEFSKQMLVLGQERWNYLALIET